MSNKFEVLKGYPVKGPKVPDREKIIRMKDRHESGTGRKDKTKRNGKGRGNWGNPEDDYKYMYEIEDEFDEENED